MIMEKTSSGLFGKRRARLTLSATALFLLTQIGALTSVWADADESEAQLVEPSMMFNAPAAQSRAFIEILQAEQAYTAMAVDAAQEAPFRATMDEAQYAAQKAQANSGLFLNSTGKPGADLSAQLISLGPPTLLGPNIEGLNQNQSGGLRPPDTHGAMGNNDYCQIVNTQLACYARAAPNAQTVNVSLASFYGYTTQILFDPRIVYDATWDRWVATAEAFPESGTVQRHFIAVSRSSNPAGAWYVYGLDINIFNNDDFWDYPQLGLTQDAVIVTGNVFGPGTFRGARMFAVAKARLYNGLGFSVPVWSGLVGTLAPPMVLDQNSNAYLLAAPPSGTTVTKYTLKNASNAYQQTLAVSNILVPSYTVPPDASQPGTLSTLDTLDARFVNASTQIGDSVFQVHTIGFPPYPIPKWYEFDVEGISADSVKQSGYMWAGGNTHDWNASIAANAGGDVFVTWSSTDSVLGVNAQVRYSGKLASDVGTFLGPGQALFTSPTFYTQFRWGDYSAVTLDPLNSSRAWIVNEKINSNTVWGSRIGRIGF